MTLADIQSPKTRAAIEAADAAQNGPRHARVVQAAPAPSFVLKGGDAQCRPFIRQLNNRPADVPAGRGAKLPARRQSHDEHDLQVAVIQWAKLASATMPGLRMLIAIGNQRACSPAQGARFKAEGVAAGVPDLALLWPSGAFHGAFLELKKPGGRFRENQLVWIAALNKAGYYASWANSLDGAIKFFTDYLTLP